jgi:hydroxypyruvate isomerase
MPRFAANLSLLFTDAPFVDRFRAAAEAGFEAVEFMFPYEFKASDIRAALHDNDLKLVLHNFPAGDWARGERGLACHPDRVADFREGVQRALDYAQALGCPRLNCLAGVLPSDVTPEKARKTLIDNLRYAAEKLEAANVGLLIEPVNSRTIPGFFVDRPSLGFSIVSEVESKNLKVQYDIFHAQVMEGDLANTIEREFARIGHLQIADNPGRHEPGTGEINYPFLFDRIDKLGYGGWIGCEYNPKTTTAEGLGWFRPYRAKAHAA